MKDANYYLQVVQDLEEEISCIRADYAALEEETQELREQVVKQGATIDRLRLHIAQGVEL